MPRPRKPRKERRSLLAVYVPVEVLPRLRKMADRDRRSASAQALIRIERGLEHDSR